MYISNLSEKALDLICILQTLRASPLIFFVLKEQSILRSLQNVFTILFSFDCICTVILTYVLRVKLILAIRTGGNISYLIGNLGLAL